MGAAFLSTGNNQSKIRGWIELDGAHNFKLGMALSVQWVKNKANQYIIAQKDSGYWQNVLDWYTNNAVINSVALMDKHAEYIGKANGYIFDLNNPNLNRFSDGQLWSPSGDRNKESFVKEKLIIELSKSYSNGLRNVTIPTLILWGRHDGILPVELAQEAYDAIGTDSLKKQIFIFENSAHSPNREDPDSFIGEFRRFIEKYK